jgi:ankyrin repeat protein
VIRLIFAKGGIDLNSKDNGGRTVLSRAAELGYKVIVELFLAKKSVNLNSKDKAGRSPLS